MKSKIIISNYDNIKNPFYAGGGAIAVHKLAKHLSKKYDVQVISGKYPHSKDRKIDGVSYKHIGISSGGPKVGQLAYFAALPITVQKEKFDLWVESFTPPFSTAVLPVFTKKPVVGLVHMLTGEDMERKYKLPFTKVEDAGLKTYKHIIVTTEETKEKILKSNKNCHISIIPNGVDLPKSVKKRKPKHILFIGRIELNQKGLDLLLEAYKKVEKEVSYPLVIAGSGEEQQVKNLKAMIKKLELTRKVTLVGYVKDKKRKELFEEAIFVVVPSRFETFCMVILDAFSFNKTVLTFDINGLAWVPSKLAVKVKPFSVNAYANNLKKLTNDDKFRNEKSKEMKVFTKNYSWNVVLSKYQKYIQTIVKPSL